MPVPTTCEKTPSGGHHLEWRRANMIRCSSCFEEFTPGSTPSEHLAFTLAMFSAAGDDQMAVTAASRGGEQHGLTFGDLRALLEGAQAAEAATSRAAMSVMEMEGRVRALDAMARRWASNDTLPSAVTTMLHSCARGVLEITSPEPAKEMTA